METSVKNEVSIFLENESFLSGDMIEGFVELKCQKMGLCVDRLTLTTSGMVQVKDEPKTGIFQKTQILEGIGSKPTKNKGFASMAKSFIFGTEPTQIPIGVHKYPFSVSLPFLLPPSYRSEDGTFKISYTLEVATEVPWGKESLNTSREISVLGSLFEKGFLEDCVSDRVERKEVFSVGGGNLQCLMSLPRRLFFVGETITGAQLSITNSTVNEFKKVSVTLVVEQIYCMSDDENKRFEELGTVAIPPVKERSQRSFKINLEIPIECCESIILFNLRSPFAKESTEVGDFHLNYFVELRGEMMNGRKRIRMKVPFFVIHPILKDRMKIMSNLVIGRKRKEETIDDVSKVQETGVENEGNHVNQTKWLVDKKILDIEKKCVEALREKCKHLKFDSFRFLQRLGQSKTHVFRYYGANSLTFLCGIEESNQVVVMKIVHNIDKETTGIQKNLLERELIDIPFHPNVAPSLNHFVAEVDYAKLPGVPSDMRQNLRSKTAIFISQYYPKNLKELIRERKNNFDVVEYLLLVEQMLRGIHHLQNHKFVHRDLKPDNIFVNAQGRLIIGDFGCVLDCKNFDGFGGFISEFAFKTFNRGGAIYYLAPEISNFQGDGVIDYTKNDVFAVGLVSYSMVCEIDPFEGNPSSSRKQKDYVELVKFSQTDTNVQDFIAGMLKIDPRKRLSCEAALSKCQELIGKYIY